MASVNKLAAGLKKQTKDFLAFAQKHNDNYSIRLNEDSENDSDVGANRDNVALTRQQQTPKKSNKGDRRTKTRRTN